MRYGPDEDQVLDLHVPRAGSGSGGGLADPVPVLLIHGGFWYARYTRALMEPLVRDLLARGHTVVNLEYRRLGAGGGWPTTFEDVAAGVDHLATLPLDPRRVVAIGHSAGGLLGLWAAARARLPTGRIGADPAVVPAAVVSLAGVNDLRAAARDGLGASAVDKVLGGAPAAVPERVRVAAPIASLPLGVPQVLVHGRQDDLVPVSQTLTYAKVAAASGDAVEVVLVDGDHFSVIDPMHPAWTAVVERLPTLGEVAA